ncbi:autotransporter domain-containing protein [Herbaspirillum sp. 3R-3a1]|nr:autotransporter domain-containing protein [Herbaspirillum sp. 3R-3a1]
MTTMNARVTPSRNNTKSQSKRGPDEWRMAPLLLAVLSTLTINLLGSQGVWAAGADGGLPNGGAGNGSGGNGGADSASDGTGGSGGGGSGGGGGALGATVWLGMNSATPISGGAGQNGGPGGSGGGGGGAGLYLIGGAGGTASNLMSVSGGAGGNGGDNPTAGGGGGGGAGLLSNTGWGTVSVRTGGIVRGGAGGNGGSGTVAGGGGGGGDGAVLSTSGLLLNFGTITGGTGGDAGSGSGGSGGSGGAGVRAGPFVIINNGAGAQITGGSGGGNALGGAGIIADTGVLIQNSGAITGGMSGDGTTRANAILFTGSSAQLILSSGTIITGNIELTGGTAANILVNSGIVSLSNNFIVGSGAQLSFVASTPFALAGNISGSGSVSFDGSNVVSLTGANTYSGATEVQSIVLRAGGANTFSANSAMTVLSFGTLDLNGYDQSVASLAGTGTVTLGTGTLTAGGDNSNTIFGGTISGAGGFTKTGSGTQILSGTNTYTGTTTINGGALQVDGTVAGTISVLNGATLLGSGTVGAVTLGSGATLASTTLGSGLHVNGNLGIGAGATYAVALGVAPGNSGQLTVNGNLNLASGSALRLVAGSGNYSDGSSYTVASYSGTRSGTFSTITNNFAYLVPVVSYGSNTVNVQLVGNAGFQSQGFGSYAGSSNQQAVANALDRIYAAGGNRVTANLLGASDAQAQRNLASLSGDTAGAASVNAVANINQGNAAIGQRLAAVDATVAGSATTVDADPWISTSISQQNQSSSSSGASGYRNHSTAFAFGHDHALSSNWLLGLAFTANADSLSYTDAGGGGRSDGGQAAMYVRYRPDASNVFFKGVVSYGWWKNVQYRQVSAGALSSQTRGQFNVQSLAMYAETGMALPMATLTVEPYAAISVARLHRPAYTETTESGNDALALAYRASNSTQTSASLGVRLRRMPVAGSPLGWQTDLAWRHRLGNNAETMQLAFANASAFDFTVRGVAQARDEAVVSGGLNYAINDTTSAFGQLSVVTGKAYASYSASVGVRWWW